MSEKIADIVAQMRGRGEDGRMDMSLWRQYADRIEEAAKREKAQPGNAAAMSKALESVNKIYDMLSKPCIVIEEVRQACQKAREVLISTPPRNCDVGTAEQQAERFAKYCDRFHRCNGCPCCGKMKYNRCEYIWAQMPYKAEKGECDA